VHDGRSGGVPAPPTKLGSIPVRGVSGSCRRSGRPRARPGRRRRGSLMERISAPSGPVPVAKECTPHTLQNRW
jgi:hypothetical protein